MFRLLASALLLATVAASPAFAQSEDSGSLGPPRGLSDGIARSMIAVLAGANKQVIDNCWNLGCVVIVNDTGSYDVVGFYVETTQPGRDPRWSQNQFHGPLWPSKATLRFKTGKAPDMCSLPVRFVLRHRETREKSEISGTTSLCTAPHKDTLIRIKMLEGQVFVRGDDEEPTPGETH
jgi:hypothetical protein